MSAGLWGCYGEMMLSRAADGLPHPSEGGWTLPSSEDSDEFSGGAADGAQGDPATGQSGAEQVPHETKTPPESFPRPTDSGSRAR